MVPERPCIEAVMFDLDGTLLDSVTAYLRVLAEIWQRCGLPEPDRDKVLDIMARGEAFWQHFDELVPAEIVDKESYKEKCLAIQDAVWQEVYPRKIKLVPASVPVLRELRARGVKLGLVTSSWGRDSYPLFQREGVDPDELFGAIVTRLDVEKPKPDPEAILVCLERLKVSAAGSVYVGDAPADIQAGKAAGVITVAVLTGVGKREELAELHPAYILPDISHLLRALAPLI